MKTMLFTFASPVGTFWIRPEPADRVQLGVDSTKLRTYASAKAAARAVAERTTGWSEWDQATGSPIPSGLDKWKRPMKTRQPARAASRRTRVAESPRNEA